MTYQWNRELCYHSGKEKGSAVGKKNKPIISEEIGKDAIKGHLICNLDYNTYLTIVRAKTSAQKIFFNNSTSLGIFDIHQSAHGAVGATTAIVDLHGRRLRR
jgi:hypothetical protein